MKLIVGRFQRQMIIDRPRLTAFTAALFVTPIAIIAIAGPAG